MNPVTIDKIKKILVDEFDVTMDLETIDENSSLFEGGLNIDSLGIVELICVLEENFDIQFEDDDLNPQYFENIKSLTTLVEQKQAS